LQINLLPMSLLDQLDDPEAWAAFLEHKQAAGQLRPSELAAWSDFIRTRGYEPVVAGIHDQAGFPLPTKRLVNKLGGRKRAVYSFPDAHSRVLKLLAHLLYRYDAKMPAGCYSFRQGTGAHQAIRSLTRRPGIGGLWCYKADVHDYFNSIDVELLLPMLAYVIDDDPPLLRFFTELLTAEPGRGVMAGVPIAPFLANIFLAGLDRHFLAAGQPYARYSDDIIVFAESRGEAEASRDFVHRWLAEHGLEVNPDKEFLTEPGLPWEFLGVSYDCGALDLSVATRAKLKGKIRRKARALRRWMLRTGAEPERALRAMIRVYNRKFFEVSGPHELNWSRWFFPLLTRDDTLHEMDSYLQQYLRWIPSGHHRAANHNLRYADLKALGYRTLVNEFHRHRAERLVPVRVV
jgi:hypothetical protein